MDSDFLKQRLQQLNWKPYTLAKKICILRARDGGVAPVSVYQSSVNKAVNNPFSSRLGTVEELIVVMGGELTVSWDNNSIKIRPHLLALIADIAAENNQTVEDTANYLIRRALINADM